MISTRIQSPRLKPLFLPLVALLVLPASVLLAQSGPIVRATPVEEVATPVPFVSNGCTGFREARFFSCCFVHDFAYWSGGTWTDRRKADGSLRQCLSDISHDKPLAYVAFALVRMTTFGGAMVDFGWGRAWRNTARDLYEPLTAMQQRGIEIERERVCGSLTLNPRTNRYLVDRAEPPDDVRQVRPADVQRLCAPISP